MTRDNDYFRKVLHRYFIKTPWLLKKLFPNYLWSIPTNEKVVYLTFDDGPEPSVTPWVLEQLKVYEAKACFFCIGKNVVQHPEIFQSILEGGHQVGNHTFNHPNGWKTSVDDYLNDIEKAAAHINSPWFRPPYGRITRKQARRVRLMKNQNVKIVMWDVLSADFDNNYSGKDCVQHVMKHVQPGSIVVFHDSRKAYKNLKHSLPEILERLSNAGFVFKRLP